MFSFFSLSRIFVKDFALLARPLYDLMKKECSFSWSVKQELAFHALKQALCSAPVLLFPDFSRPSLVTTDASHYAVGCVVSQVFSNGEHPISFASRLLKVSEIDYSNTDRKLLGVVFGVEHHRSYLCGSQFTVRTVYSV